MVRQDNLEIDVWLAIVPFLIGVGCLLGPTLFEYGMLDMTLGHLAWAFWLTALAWLVSVVIVIRRTRWWWVLLSGLPIAIPVAFAMALMAACYSGNCI